MKPMNIKVLVIGDDDVVYDTMSRLTTETMITYDPLIMRLRLDEVSYYFWSDGSKLSYVHASAVLCVIDGTRFRVSCERVLDDLVLAQRRLGEAIDVFYYVTAGGPGVESQISRYRLPRYSVGDIQPIRDWLRELEPVVAVDDDDDGIPPLIIPTKKKSRWWCLFPFC